MERYKTCPACGHVNSEEELLCGKCGIEIVFVSAAGRREEGGRAARESGGGPPPAKICPKCGAANPDYSVLCDSCMADISAVSAAAPSGSGRYDGAPAGAYERTAEKTRPRLVLSSISERIKISVLDGGIVGRCDACDPPKKRQGECAARDGERHEIDCARFNTVSRRHLKFVFDGGECFIVPLPESTNKTFLNGAEIRRGVRHAIKTGDRIGLSTKLELGVEIIFE